MSFELSNFIRNLDLRELLSAAEKNVLRAMADNVYRHDPTWKLESSYDPHASPSIGELEIATGYTDLWVRKLLKSLCEKGFGKKITDNSAIKKPNIYELKFGYLKQLSTSTKSINKVTQLPSPSSIKKTQLGNSVTQTGLPGYPALGNPVTPIRYKDKNIYMGSAPQNQFSLNEVGNTKQPPAKRKTHQEQFNLPDNRFGLTEWICIVKANGLEFHRLEAEYGRFVSYYAGKQVEWTLGGWKKQAKNWKPNHTTKEHDKTYVIPIDDEDHIKEFREFVKKLPPDDPYHEHLKPFGGLEVCEKAGYYPQYIQAQEPI